MVLEGGKGMNLCEDGMEIGCEGTVSTKRGFGRGGEESCACPRCSQCVMEDVGGREG